MLGTQEQSHSYPSFEIIIFDNQFLVGMFKTESPLPKGFDKKFKDFKQLTTEKDLPFSSYVVLHAISFADEQPYTILLFNLHSKICAKNRDLALTLYLQEIFFLCARFGEYIGKDQLKLNDDNENPGNFMLDFQNFTVEGDKIAFAMKQAHSLLELMEQNKESAKSTIVDIEDMIEDMYASIHYANTRFGISNIDIRPETVFAISIHTEESDQQINEYFITNWASGARKDAELINQSVLSLREREKILRFIKLKHDEEDPRQKFAVPQSFQNPTLKSDTSADIYAMGLLGLELLGIQHKTWKSLLASEDPEMYDLVLNKIMQNLTKILEQELAQGELNEASQTRINEITTILSTLLKTEPKERMKGFKKLLSDIQAKRESENQNVNAFKFSDSLANDYEQLSKEMKELLKGVNSASIKVILLDQKQLKVNFMDEIVLGILNKWFNLEQFNLTQNRIGDREAVIIGSNTTWKNLASLILTSNKIGDEGASAISKNTIWECLEHLDLSDNRIGDQGAVAIGSNSTWKNLKYLDLDSNMIGDGGASALGKNTTWVNLEVILLHYNEIGDNGAVAIGTNPTWKNLKKLYLGENKIGDEGASAIGRNTTWVNLEELGLNENQIGDTGTIAIGGSSLWRNLKLLILHTNSIGDEGAKAIGKNTVWTNLEQLDLRCNNIGDPGALALGNNTVWKNLKEFIYGKIR